MFAKGTKVRLKQPVIKGTISSEPGERRFNDTAEEMEYLLPYVDGTGEEHTKWFLESELEAEEEA